MPQWDKARNYYADLELPLSASADDIKKQYRKLVLQWHPDRNRGNETRANIKFQSIQSAYEILVDERSKREYDMARGVFKSRFPTASGVRGNPWQDAGKQYPRPPTRHPQSNTQPRPSGAQRYATDFGGAVPRAGGGGSGNSTKDEQRNHYTAWQNMRPSGRGKPNPNPPPTPGRAPTSATRESRQESPRNPEPSYVPPRTASQKQKAEAAFGTRKTGYVPRSPGLGDEPPVTSKNYFTTRVHTNIFGQSSTGESEASASQNGGPGAQPATPIPDPLAKFRDSYLDARQSSPYHTTGGEKTRVEGLGRTTSTRTPPRKPEMPGTFPRPRSSSTASINVNIGSYNDETPNASPTPGYSGKGRSTNTKTTNGNGPFQAPPSNPFNPTFGSTGNPPATPNKPTANAQPAQTDGHPSVYDPKLYPPSAAFSQRSTPFTQFLASNKSKKKSSSGGDQSSSPRLFPFEEFQRREVERIIKSKRRMLGKDIDKLASSAKKNKEEGPAVVVATKDTKKPIANSTSPRSFKLPVDPSAHRLARDSTENINTSFVQGDPAGDWHFTAGSPVANEQPQPPSAARPIRRPTTKSRTATMNSIPTTQGTQPKTQGIPTTQDMPTTQAMPTTQGMPAAQATSKDTINQGFSAGEWSEKIGSEHFAPQPLNGASTSPTRRQNSRKTKPANVKATAGTANMVDTDENEGWREIPRSQPSSVPTSTDSPVAMDIDSPPAETTDTTPKAPQTNGARNIPVEPHRPDWRAGNVKSVPPKTADPVLNASPAKRPFTEKTSPEPTSASAPVPTSAKQFPVHNGGSEDTEEFRTTLSDLKKTEPFMEPAPTGLKSFADMKSTLPFESRASDQIQVEKQSRPASLEFPIPPVAPRLPPTVAVKSLRPNITQWRKYAQDFYNYMDKWEVFNAKVVEHFSTRQKNFVGRRQQHGPAWLSNPPDSSNLEDYLTELQQDQEVQRKWTESCAAHRDRVREYMEFKDRIK